MPPNRNYSRDVLEKVAALVDQLATVVDAFCSSTAGFEAISQKLTVQTTITRTESNYNTPHPITKDTRIKPPKLTISTLDGSKSLTEVTFHDQPIPKGYPFSTNRNTSGPTNQPSSMDSPCQPQPLLKSCFGLPMQNGWPKAHEPGPAKKDPPWGILIVDYGNLGLEDKADGSIDTRCSSRTWTALI
ncbi:hypothetical protein Tco_1469297 [Tanacetum coccineum]